MARSRRVLALAAVAAVAAWTRLPSAPCLANYQDGYMHGVDAPVTPMGLRNNIAAIRAVMKHLRQHSTGPTVANNQFDINAIGESWHGSTMNYWVDRAGAATPAEGLEQQLMTMKVGGVAGTEGRRQAMHLKRLSRQQHIDEKQQRSSNSMQHWVDRAASMESSEDLEETLMGMKIGGVSGTEGQRQAMHLKRAAQRK